MPAAPSVTPGRWFRRAGARAERYERVLGRYSDRLPVFSTEAVAAPAAKVTVLVPTLNEEDYVEDACRSLALQTLGRDHPDLFEIILVDSGSRDATVDLARPFVSRVVTAPRGKLNALMLGVAEASGGIVVEADADGWFPPGWVAAMARPFDEPNVAGVRGTFVYYDSPLLRVGSYPMRRTLGALGNFPGGVRAYRRTAFLQAGGFNTSIDQTNFWEVWPEEEFKFRRRLAKSGRVVDARDAVCFKSARRGDPVFVRDPRADKFRHDLAAEGRFQDGVTDRIYKVRKYLGNLALFK